MKLWVPLAFAVVVVLAYALFYVLDSLEGQGASALGLANAAGLVTVAVGVIVALLVLGRVSKT